MSSIDPYDPQINDLVDRASRPLSGIGRQLTELQSMILKKNLTEGHAERRLRLAGRFMAAEIAHSPSSGHELDDPVLANHALRRADLLLARWAATNPGGEEGMKP